MNYQLFYRQLFAPLESKFGPIDCDTIVALMGFDGGGPRSFCTFGAELGNPLITYVSCELAVRLEQQPCEFGRYELLSTCDDEGWVRGTLSDIGWMSLDTTFGHGPILDIGPGVAADDPIQGIVFDKVCAVEIENQQFGILGCIGITRPEMDFARLHGSQALFDRLSAASCYPQTLRKRESVIESFN